MPRTQRPIDELLKEAQDRKAKITARLQALEAKKRKIDSKTRGKAEQTLMRILFDQIATQPGFKNVVAELVRVTPLRPDEQEAIQWLLSSLDPPRASNANPAPAPDIAATTRVA